jgi:hypothetical protein
MRQARFTGFYLETANENLQYLGDHIFEKLKVDTLLLHSSKEAIAFNKEGSFAAELSYS